MSLEPDPLWADPAREWTEVIARYTTFLQVESWRGRTHTPDGKEIRNKVDADEAQKRAERLKSRLRELEANRALPPLDSPFSQSAVDRMLSGVLPKQIDRRFDQSPGWLQDLWRAIVLNKHGYTCYYCHRTAWGVYEELSATLRIELDHKIAKSRLDERDDFDVENIVAACRSCNEVKGQMTVAHFLRELKSLARAVTDREPGPAEETPTRV